MLGSERETSCIKLVAIGLIGLMVVCVVAFAGVAVMVNLPLLQPTLTPTPTQTPTATPTVNPAMQQTIQSVVNAFMVALKQRDYATVYALSHPDLQAEAVDAEGFEVWAEENAVYPISWQLATLEVNGAEAYVRLEVEWEDESGIPMLLTLTHDGVWGLYIIEFDISFADAATPYP